MKSVLGIFSEPQHPHWLGNGFPVRTLFSYKTLGRQLSPFLLFDHVGPANFAPSQQLRRAGQHAHRGLETVTIVYQGELAYLDSAGVRGCIGPGDVQWITAGAGIQHDEFHSGAFSRTGGTLEIVQVWVNLPARNKMATPAYQTLLSANIPAVPLSDGAGVLRLIAGQFGVHKGLAKTFTDINVWDLRLSAGKLALLPLKAGHTAAIVMLSGSVLAGDSSVVRSGQWALISQDESHLVLGALANSAMLILSGEPINEPIVGCGSFCDECR